MVVRHIVIVALHNCVMKILTMRAFYVDLNTGPCRPESIIITLPSNAVWHRLNLHQEVHNRQQCSIDGFASLVCGPISKGLYTRRRVPHVTLKTAVSVTLSISLSHNTTRHSPHHPIHLRIIILEVCLFFYTQVRHSKITCVKGYRR